MVREEDVYGKIIRDAESGEKQQEEVTRKM